MRNKKELNNLNWVNHRMKHYLHFNYGFDVGKWKQKHFSTNEPRKFLTEKLSMQSFHESALDNVVLDSSFGPMIVLNKIV